MHNRYMSVEDLETIVEEATCPADLFELLEKYNLCGSFYPPLSELWRKKYDPQKDYVKLRSIEQGLHQ